MSRKWALSASFSYAGKIRLPKLHMQTNYFQGLATDWEPRWDDAGVKSGEPDWDHQCDGRDFDREGGDRTDRTRCAHDRWQDRERNAQGSELLRAFAATAAADPDEIVLTVYTPDGQFLFRATSERVVMLMPTPFRQAAIGNTKKPDTRQ